MPLINRSSRRERWLPRHEALVCWGTWRRPTPLIADDSHPCGVAHQALEEAGYEPDVVRTYGYDVLPGIW